MKIISPNNLKLFVPFQNSALDASSNHYTGIMNGCTLIEGLKGNVVNFSGGVEYVDYGSTVNTVLFGGNTLSYGAWIKISAVDATTGAFFIMGPSWNYIMLISNSSLVSVVYVNGQSWWNANTAVATPFTLVKDKWYRVITTYNGHYIKNYVNGQFMGQSNTDLAGAGYSIGLARRFGIGRYLDESNTWQFTGQIDEPFVYKDKAMSDKEIALDYYGSKRGKIQCG